MWNDEEVGRKTVLLVPVIAVMLVAGWFGVRRRVAHQADQDLPTPGK
ncbi:amino acid permease [Streptomyces violaceorubidus]